MLSNFGGAEILIVVVVVGAIAGMVAIVVMLIRSGEHPAERAVSADAPPPVNESGASPSGWYPDPDDASQRRYWDGNVWTKRTEPY
jgi:hypothetical protein